MTSSEWEKFPYGGEIFRIGISTKNNFLIKVKLHVIEHKLIFIWKDSSTVIYARLIKNA
jgi:hypothetical protein